MLSKDKWKKRMTTKKRLKRTEAEYKEIYKIYNADNNDKCAIPSNGQWKSQNHMTMSNQLMPTYKRQSYTYKNKHFKTKASTTVSG